MHGLKNTGLEMLLFWTDIHYISKETETKKGRHNEPRFRFRSESSFLVFHYHLTLLLLSSEDHWVFTPIQSSCWEIYVSHHHNTKIIWCYYNSIHFQGLKTLPHWFIKLLSSCKNYLWLSVFFYDVCMCIIHSTDPCL